MSTLREFRDAVQAEADRTPSPGLRGLLERDRPTQVLQWRWAAAATVLITLGAVPVYRERQQQEADARLMREVNAALARPVARAFSALMVGGN